MKKRPTGIAALPLPPCPSRDAIFLYLFLHRDVVTVRSPVFYSSPYRAPRLLSDLALAPLTFDLAVSPAPLSDGHDLPDGVSSSYLSPGPAYDDPDPPDPELLVWPLSLQPIGQSIMLGGTLPLTLLCSATLFFSSFCLC